jgi:hypothetical protein
MCASLLFSSGHEDAYSNIIEGGRDDRMLRLHRAFENTEEHKVFMVFDTEEADGSSLGSHRVMISGNVHEAPSVQTKILPSNTDVSVDFSLAPRVLFCLSPRAMRIYIQVRQICANKVTQLAFQKKKNQSLSSVRLVYERMGRICSDSPKASRHVGSVGLTYGIIFWDQIRKGRNDFSFCFSSSTFCFM